jgi:translation initiation factor IF-3
VLSDLKTYLIGASEHSRFTTRNESCLKRTRSQTMRHCSHLSSTAEALQRVFFPTLRTIVNPSRASSAPFQNPPNAFLKRCYASAPPDGAFNMAGRFVRANKFSKAEDQRKRDEGIHSQEVCLVQPNGKLGRPQSLSWVLSRIDRKAEFVEQYDEVDGIPVCKIINKKEAREAAKSRKKQKQPAAVTKYLELNWAIDHNDLAHRLGKLKEFLERGHRVEVLLLKKKKRMRDATAEEGKQTLESLSKYVKGVEGAKEIRPMEGDFLGRATLYYEGKVKANKDASGRLRADAVEEESKSELAPPEEPPGRQAAYG